MNVFASLDSLFPTGEARLSGEVVSVSLDFHYNGSLVGRLSWKRKARYVNASVNAFHMHRGLAREFQEQIALILPRQCYRSVKRLIALSVLNSYLNNYQTGGQYSSYYIHVTDSAASTSKDVESSLWRNGCDEAFTESREICDAHHMKLREICFHWVAWANSPKFSL